MALHSTKTKRVLVGDVLIRSDVVRHNALRPGVHAVRLVEGTLQSVQHGLGQWQPTLQLRPPGAVFAQVTITHMIVLTMVLFALRRHGASTSAGGFGLHVGVQGSMWFFYQDAGRLHVVYKQ